MFALVSTTNYGMLRLNGKTHSVSFNAHFTLGSWETIFTLQQTKEIQLCRITIRFLHTNENRENRHTQEAAEKIMHQVKPLSVNTVPYLHTDN